MPPQVWYPRFQRMAPYMSQASAHRVPGKVNGHGSRCHPTTVAVQVPLLPGRVFVTPRARADMTSVSISTGCGRNGAGSCGMSTQRSESREVGYLRFVEGGGRCFRDGN